MEAKTEAISKCLKLKSRNGKVDRIILKAENTSRVDVWISQIEKEHPALRVSRQDLVNFIILRHPVELSDGELTQLQGSHFNAIRYSQWVTQEIKNATARGETITREELFRLYAKCQSAEDSGVVPA